MLLAIVLTSVLWRLCVSVCFSSAFIRKCYERFERVVGV